MRIGVIFPSRGLAFSRTCEELLDNLENLDYEIYFAHGLPIPECFNRPVEAALKDKKNTHFFFVEDDMILPKNLLIKLLAEKVPAIACDYPLTKDGKASILRTPDGTAIYGGTGCLLVTRKFIESYKRPIFRTDIAWDVHEGETLEMTPRKINGNAYGLHDITFSLLAPNPIKASRVRCGQRKLIELGAQATNTGQHDIESWTDLKIDKLKKIKETNKNVILSDGTMAFMDLKRARVLEEKGLVKIPKMAYVTLMHNEVLEEIC